MFGLPKHVHADVTIESIDPLNFSVSPSMDHKKPPVTMKGGRVIFHNKNHPGFKVHFHLKGRLENYLFPKNKYAIQAVWSQFGDGACPNSEVREVFTNPRISPDGKTLTVQNDNCREGKFGYTLRVTNDDGKNYLPLDPGGENENGPRGFTLAYAAIGVITVIVAVFAAFEFGLFRE